MSFRSKQQRTFRKGLDLEDALRKREEVTVNLRRATRHDQLHKRRAQFTIPEPTAKAASKAAEHLKDAFKNADLEEKLAQIAKLVDGVNSDDEELQLECVSQFRRLLSLERNPPIQPVIDSGVVPRLLQFLTFNHNHKLQFEASWAVTNIASGTTQHTQHTIDNGAIPLFVNLMSSPSKDVCEQAVWALGNIAGDSWKCRDMVLEAGAMEPLLKLCQSGASPTLLRNATWTLSNFCRGKPQPPFEMVSPALPCLAQLIHCTDAEVLADACWALSYLSDDTGAGNAKIQAVLQAGVARRLVELLMHNQPNVQTPALRTVGNIVTGDDLQTQVMLSCDVLPCLRALLSHSKKGIRKETCWALSNITAGNAHQIQAVIDADIVTPLAAALSSAEFDIAKEAAWAISNSTSGGTAEQLRVLAHAGVIEPLCKLFKLPDAKIVMVALEGIENFLRVGQRAAQAAGATNNIYCELIESCGGLEDLEGLQHHANEEIYSKAVRILENYFAATEEGAHAETEIADDEPAR